MKRVAYEEMVAQFTRVLEKHGFTPSDAKDAAVIFAQNSLSGVYSHGLNRFPRVVSYLEKGEIDPLARAECISRMGSMERWDGHRGFGPLNAQRAMERACALAKENGVGIVALGNNNHWMRGGTYGWLAAEKGCIGICWSNTAPNMPAWGAKDCRIGNNQAGEHPSGWQAAARTRRLRRGRPAHDRPRRHRKERPRTAHRLLEGQRPLHPAGFDRHPPFRRQCRPHHRDLRRRDRSDPNHDRDRPH